MRRSGRRFESGRCVRVSRARRGRVRRAGGLAGGGADAAGCRGAALLRARVASVGWSPGGFSGTFGVAGTPRGCLCDGSYPESRSPLASRAPPLIPGEDPSRRPARPRLCGFGCAGAAINLNLCKFGDWTPAEKTRRRAPARIFSRLIAHETDDRRGLRCRSTKLSTRDIAAVVARPGEGGGRHASAVG